MGSLQVLIHSSRILVAGLPSALRNAHRAAAELDCARIVFCGFDESQRRRFGAQLAKISRAPVDFANDKRPLAGLDGGAPLLVLNADGFAQPQALAGFVRRAQGLAHGSAGAFSQPLRWRCGGAEAGVYYPRAEQAMAASKEPARAESVEMPGWMATGSPEQAAAAEGALLAGLAKDTDGYIARFDRKLSTAISRRLLRWPITPNHITTISLILGLLGSWWLASGDYALTLAGASLLWFCCLLDGCDGEVARLKLLCSPSGAAYDVAADQLAHLATFVAIPIGVYRARPGVDFWTAGALLVSGFLGCMFSVWYLVLRKSEEERGPYALLIERIASRDYVYLIVVLAAIGRLDWFLYAAGVGSHVFWIVLWLLPRQPQGAISGPTTAA